MFLVTCEDDEGMWWEDPVGADTEIDARRIAVEKFRPVPDGYKLVLYKCEMLCDLDERGKKQAKG